MAMKIKEMTIEDHKDAIHLWENAPGIGLSNADSERNIFKYLQRNPGMSFVAFDGELMVGAILCGHDGRRGYINHLAVHSQYHMQGIGKNLVDACLDKLKQCGIEKSHILVYADNHKAIDFWQHTGWELRMELVIMSRDVNILDQ